MPSKVTRNGSLPDASQVEVVVTPKRKLGSTSKGKEESSKGLQATLLTVFVVGTGSQRLGTEEIGFSVSVGIGLILLVITLLKL